MSSDIRLSANEGTPQPTWTYYILILSMIIMSVGSSPFYTLGITFLTDHLNKDDQIIIPFHAINRNPPYYSGLIDPVQFYLERFLNEIIMKIKYYKTFEGHDSIIG